MILFCLGDPGRAGHPLVSQHLRHGCRHGCRQPRGRASPVLGLPHEQLIIFAWQGGNLLRRTNKLELRGNIKVKEMLHNNYT